VQDAHSTRRPTVVLAGVVLLAVTAALYARVSAFGFINYDDELLVYRNPHVNTGLSLANLAWAFTSTDRLQWAPLTWITHMLDFQLLGPDASGHHLVSVGFHLLDTALLLAFLWKTSGSVWRSTIVSAMFALHPTHVEPVAWLSARKDLVSTAFLLVTLLVYAWYARRPGAARYVATLGAFAGSLMSKPMYVTLPVLLLALDYWPLDRLVAGGGSAPASASRRTARLLIEKVPFLALSVAFSAIGYAAQSTSDAVSAFALDQLGSRASTVAVAYGHMLWKTAWPSALSIVYPVPASSASFAWWIVLGSVALVLAISAIVVRLGRANRFLVTGWVWFLATLLPVTGIVKIGSAVSADKFSYIPIVGLFIMVAWGAHAALAGSPDRVRRPVLVAVASGVLVLFAARTTRYLDCWRDSFALYSEALAVTENNFLVMANLAAAYQAQGNFDEAIRYYEQSIVAEPRFEVGYSNLGYLWLRKRDCGRAVPYFTAALQINPGYHNAEFGLAYCLRQ
jgi:tetratricopeptide (TPR) repeat protein